MAISATAASNCTAAHLPYPSVFGALITSLSAAVRTNYTGLGVDVCQVNVTLTHPGANDTVFNQVLLPLAAWNGRFQGLGGGGYTAGIFSSLAPAAAQGYSCVTTDSGHTTNSGADATPWALVSEGNVNQYLLLDFAHRSYHDMTVLGKAITRSFYGKSPAYSYFSGCSTGGRQGLVEAQRYPDDYDGILANAPAVQWNDFTPAQQWPYTVMNNEGYAPSQCEFSAVVAATIAACDADDGLVDNIISAPALCTFNLQSLVGKNYTCNTDHAQRTFSQTLVNVVTKIMQGPVTPQGEWLWYGITPGTNFSSLAPTTTSSNGTASAQPFLISDSWYRDFLFRDMSYNTSSITYEQFAQLFSHGHQDYDSTMGSASPDLSAFRARGGKMITWQGLADNYIMPQGNMYYYAKVAALDPFVADFYRQFYSPGVGHCGGGTGVMPLDALGQLRAWVENGTAPVTLAAASLYPVNTSSSRIVNGTVARRQDLCPYPMVNVYVKGDPNAASSYKCAAHTGWQNFGTPQSMQFI